MKDPAKDQVAAAASRVVRGRDAQNTAPVRCAAYAAWSELFASPHDLDPREALREKIGIGAKLPYAIELDPLLERFAATDLGELKMQYSGLFEVGNDGPPMPIREDLQTGQHAGTREDLVRFYNFFGYSLAEQFAWQPDHLSVELEFMHYLCYREASAESNLMSYQFAQLDFCTRHLHRWVPAFTAKARKMTTQSLYDDLLASLCNFIEMDYQWQNSTIEAVSGNSGNS